MNICRICNNQEELQLGICFDCAFQGEERAARRTVFQHLRKAFFNLRHSYFQYVRFDLTWAWQRLTRAGDYTKNGYFDQQRISWR